MALSALRPFGSAPAGLTLRRAMLSLAALLLLGMTGSLSGCGIDWGGQKSEAKASDTAESLQSKAERAASAGNFVTASELYSEIDRRFPYSPLAIPSQLQAAYALYRAERYEQSIAAAERFISLHPGSPNVAYAYYLRALNSYDQISDVGRDQKLTLEAKEAFEELIRRFPDSPYAKDAKVKVDLTVDQLAGKEMDVGRYYQSRRNYLAAVNRYRTVVEDFDDTAHVQEALYRLSEVYLSLGVRPEAQSAAAVLGYNYPESKWYKRSYDLLNNNGLRPKLFEGSWLSRARTGRR